METYFFAYHNEVYKVLWCSMLPIKPGAHGRTPSLFNKCTGFALHNTQDQGLYTNGRSNGQVSCLRTQVSRSVLEPTLCLIETSGALIRSATTGIFWFWPKEVPVFCFSIFYPRLINNYFLANFGNIYCTHVYTLYANSFEHLNWHLSTGRVKKKLTGIGDVFQNKQMTLKTSVKHGF